MLQEIPATEPSDRALSRIRSGRHGRRFKSVLQAYAVYRDLISHLDSEAIKLAVETRGLTTRDDATLFELLCLFKILDSLRDSDWIVPQLQLNPRKKITTATRGSDSIEVWYQHTPTVLGSPSRYVTIQKDHGFSHAKELIPDIVLRFSDGVQTRWLVIEAKMGTERTVQDSARACLLDLLAYDKAFSTGLSSTTEPVGLGIAWGSGLTPTPSRYMLATHDAIKEALDLFVRAP